MNFKNIQNLFYEFDQFDINFQRLVLLGSKIYRLIPQFFYPAPIPKK